MCSRRYIVGNELVFSVYDLKFEVLTSQMSSSLLQLIEKAFRVAILRLQALLFINIGPQGLQTHDYGPANTFCNPMHLLLP